MITRAMHLGVLVLGSCAPRNESSPSELKQKDVSSDGIIAIHFTEDFEVKKTSSAAGSSITLGTKTPATHGTVTFVTKPKITSTLEGFVKEFHEPTASESQQSRSAAMCAGKPGIEIRNVWLVNDHPFVKRYCYAIVNGRGFIGTYVILKEEAAAHEPRLRAIVDATEFLK